KSSSRVWHEPVIGRESPIPILACDCATYLILSVVGAQPVGEFASKRTPCRRSPPVPSGLTLIRQRPGFRAILRRSPAPAACSGLGPPRHACHPRPLNGYAGRGTGVRPHFALSWHCPSPSRYPSGWCGRPKHVPIGVPSMNRTVALGVLVLTAVFC